MIIASFKKYFILSIVIIILFATILAPSYFQYAGSYSTPSVINGITIFENGHLVDSSALYQGRLASDLDIEESYPPPSILTAILIAISGLPYNKIAFIPIAGLGSLLFFILARYILPDKRSNYTLILAAAYFVLNVSTRFHTMITGREPIGVILLILFIISYLKLLESPGSKIFPWLITCLLTTIAAGMTYYTTALAIIVIVIISFVTPQNKFSSGHPRGSAILILAILLFITPPVVAREASFLHLQNFFGNILGSILERLGAEGSKLNENYLASDPISQVRLWGLRIVLFLSVISTAIIIFRGIINPEERKSRQWLYAVIVIGVCSTELAYLLKDSIISTRFIVAFGSLCPLILMCKFDGNKRKILTVAIVSLMMIVSFTNINFHLNGESGGVKPYGIEKVQPVTDYIAHNIPNGTIAADAGYSSNIWLMQIHNNSKINVFPIGRDALSLKDAQNGLVEPLNEVIKHRKLNYLLLNTDMPFFGDVWGYSVILHRDHLESLPFDSIYDNGRFVLYKTGL